LSQSVANIHDAFCKQALGDPGRAKRFLREHLPPAVAALLSDRPPELLPVSFVDEGLRQHHSDLLFRVVLKTGGDAFVYIVMEHKSAPDPLARLQLLRYIIRILLRWVEEHREAKLPVLPLPPVIPLLVHHGPDGWSASTDFADLFGPVPDALRPYLPQFHHAPVDLIGISDSELSADAALRMRLKAMKYALWPDLVRWLEVILADAGTLDDVDVVAVLIYLMLVNQIKPRNRSRKGRPLVGVPSAFEKSGTHEKARSNGSGLWRSCPNHVKKKPPVGQCPRLAERG